MASPAATPTLTRLGFTGLEAEVYTFLLGESPATGYRAAQAIGKPVANTYKAIESLESRGAVIVDDGERRMCRAVAPAELLRGMERAYAARCAEAEAALRELHEPGGDDRVYALRTREQALGRAREMLARAERVAVIDAMPGLMRDLAPDIAACAKRGVIVWALGYEPADVAPANIVVAPKPDFIKVWLGEQFALATDAKEFLCALCGRDGGEVLQSLWTASPFLATLEHDNLVAQVLTKLCERAVARGDSVEAIAAGHEGLRPIFTRHTPGYARLAERFTAKNAGGGGGNGSGKRGES